MENDEESDSQDFLFIMVVGSSILNILQTCIRAIALLEQTSQTVNVNAKVHLYPVSKD